MSLDELKIELSLMCEFVKVKTGEFVLESVDMVMHEQETPPRHDCPFPEIVRDLFPVYACPRRPAASGRSDSFSS